MQRKTSTVIAFLGVKNSEAASPAQTSLQHELLGIKLCFSWSPQTTWKLLIPSGGELGRTAG